MWGNFSPIVHRNVAWPLFSLLVYFIFVVCCLVSVVYIKTINNIERKVLAYILQF